MKLDRIAVLDRRLIGNSSVTWSGGGDIRPDNIKEWTLEHLKEVAMGFPDAVAACERSYSWIPRMLC